MVVSCFDAAMSPVCALGGAGTGGTITRWEVSAWKKVQRECEIGIQRLGCF